MTKTRKLIVIAPESSDQKHLKDYTEAPLILQYSKI